MVDLGVSNPVHLPDSLQVMLASSRVRAKRLPYSGIVDDEIAVSFVVEALPSSFLPAYPETSTSAHQVGWREIAEITLLSKRDPAPQMIEGYESPHVALVELG